MGLPSSFFAMRYKLRVECASIALECAIHRSLSPYQSAPTQSKDNATHKIHRQDIHLRRRRQTAEPDVPPAEHAEEAQAAIRRQQAGETDERHEDPQVRPAEAALDLRPDERAGDACKGTDDADDDERCGGHVQGRLGEEHGGTGYSREP